MVDSIICHSEKLVRILYRFKMDFSHLFGGVHYSILLDLYMFSSIIIIIVLIILI